MDVRQSVAPSCRNPPQRPTCQDVSGLRGPIDGYVQAPGPGRASLRMSLPRLPEQHQIIGRIGSEAVARTIWQLRCFN